MNNEDTVREALIRAGGFSEVARKIGANRRETVRWWAVKNRVPARWIPVLAPVVGKPESWFWRLYREDGKAA